MILRIKNNNGLVFLTRFTEKTILATAILVFMLNAFSFATTADPENKILPSSAKYDFIFHGFPVNWVYPFTTYNFKSEYCTDINKYAWEGTCFLLKVDSEADEVLTDRSTDQNIKVNDLYPAAKVENPREKNFLGASLEIGAILLVGNLIYYLNGEANKKDYVYSTDEAFAKRFTTTETLVFDTNTMRTNAMAHPMAGAGYYIIPRANGFNSMESFAFSFISSGFWEYFCEFREITSINDLIITPFGGMAFGESIYQFAAYFAAADSGFFSDFVNYWMLDGRNYYRGARVNSSVWNDMKVFAGGGNTDKNDEFINFGIDLEMYGIKRFNRSGKISGVLFNGPYSKILLNSKIGGYGLKEFQCYSETALIAYVNQHLRAEEDSSSGHTVYLGINSAFDYKKFKTGDFMDELGIAHIAGPVADVFLKFNSAQIRMRLAVFGDFACVQSFGLAPYLADSHSSDDIENRGAYVTAEQGYYYGRGITSDALISAQWKNFEIGSQFVYHHYNSLDEPQDRNPKSDNPIKMKDIRSELKSWILFNFPDLREVVKFEYSRKFLEGSADRYDRSTVENCFHGSVQYKIK